MSWNKPTDAELAVWEQAKKLPAFHPDDLVRYGIQLSTARKYTQYWKHRGWVCLVRKDAKMRKFFCALEMKDQVKQPVCETPTLEGNMWRSMRQLSTFTPLDIEFHATSSSIEVTSSKARSYCQKLLNIGYLRVRERAIPGKREATYSLIEDTGARAPVLVRLNGVLDPNTDQFFPTDPRLRP